MQNPTQSKPLEMLRNHVGRGLNRLCKGQREVTIIPTLLGMRRMTERITVQMLKEQGLAHHRILYVCHAAVEADAVGMLMIPTSTPQKISKADLSRYDVIIVGDMHAEQRQRTAESTQSFNGPIIQMPGSTLDPSHHHPDLEKDEE